MSDEIDITQMPTDELLELMGEDLYDGYADEVVEEVEECLKRGMAPYDVLTKGLVAGMDIVGNDVLNGRIQARCTSTGLAPFVRFHGFLVQRELQRLMQSMHILVISSRHEAGPVAMLEAQAGGECRDVDDW